MPVQGPASGRGISHSHQDVFLSKLQAMFAEELEQEDRLWRESEEAGFPAWRSAVCRQGRQRSRHKPAQTRLSLQRKQKLESNMNRPRIAHVEIQPQRGASQGHVAHTEVAGLLGAGGCRRLSSVYA